MNQLSVSWSDVKAFIVARGVSPQWVVANNMYHVFAIDSNFGLSCVIPLDGTAASDVADFEANFKASGNQSPRSKVAVDSQVALPPFAEPTYRTKRSKTTDLVTVAPGSSATIDFLVTQERYVYGGTILVVNAQFGDWVTAEVTDRDGVIPVAYRPVLCENYPCVAQYCDGEWIAANLNGVTDHEINTFPLSAKVTAGLYLRVTYNAKNTGVARQVGVNYYLNKRIG